jgi:periplasmic copper chaperone A
VAAAAIIGLSQAATAWAGSASAAPIMVSGAWSRVTPSADSAAVVYLTVTDSSTPDTLLGARTPVAKTAALHQSRMANGIMEMGAVGTLALAPGKPLAFAPGGYHIMLTGLAHVLNAGDHFPITLTFAHAGAVTAEVTVQPMSYAPPAADMGGM